MLVDILRPFVCKSRDLKPGDSFDLPDHLVDRLVSDGYVRVISKPKVIAVAEPAVKVAPQVMTPQPKQNWKR